MSVCQRKTKSGKPGAWLVKYKDAATGQWKQRQFKTQQAAEEFDAAAKIALEKDSPLSVREAVLAYLQVRELSSGRVWMYKFLVNGHARKNGTHTEGPAEFIADRYVESLNRQDLEAMRSKMKATGSSVSRINTYTGMLKSIFAWCESEDLIDANPWRKYRLLRSEAVKHRDGTMEELRAVYALLPPHIKWVVKTVMALCLRPGSQEVFALEWDAFDWKSKTATVYMPKVKRSKTVVVPEWYLAEALPRYQEDTAAGYTLVCRNGQNRPITYPAFWKQWRIARNAAGTKIPPYAIRHIVASEMHYAGVDMASVAAQLGHKSIKTTEDIYTHPLKRGQCRAAAMLPDATKLGE